MAIETTRRGFMAGAAALLTSPGEEVLSKRLAMTANGSFMLLDPPSPNIHVCGQFKVIRSFKTTRAAYNVARMKFENRELSRTMALLLLSWGHFERSMC